jgi:hypothetical protein
LGSTGRSSIGLRRLLGPEPCEDGIEDGEGVGVISSKGFQTCEGGCVRRRGVLLEEAAIEVVNELGLGVGDELEDLEESGDGLGGAFVLLFPLEKKLLEWVVGLRRIEG